MRTKFGLAALFAAVLGFVGCSNVDEQGGTNNDTPAPAEYQLTINATAHEPATRVVISGDKTNGFETSWEVGDLLGVFTDTETADASDRDVRTYNYRLEATTVNSDGTAVFSASLYNGTYAGVNDLYAYYPYKSALATANNYASTTTFENVKCQIPAEQAMTESGSYDPTAAYMVARPSTIDLSESTAVETTMTFRHLNCFVNLSTKSVTADGVSGDEVVNSIAMTVAGKTLAGDFELNLADGSTNFTSTSETITVAVPDGTTLADLSAWLVVNPFSLESGDELELVITTNKNTITKTITGKTINFAIKNVITLNLAIDNTCTVEPFTESNLFADGTYVIAYDKNIMTVGTSTNTYRGYKTYTTLPTENSEVAADEAWIVTAIGNVGDNTYTIKSASTNTYLGWTSGNSAILVGTPDKSTTMIIAETNGGYIIKSNTDNTRTLRYNAGSRFAFYGATSNIKNETLTLVPVKVGINIILNSSQNVTLEETAANETISYKVTGTTADAKVSVTLSDGAEEWITIGEITSTSVAYSVAANTTAERSATITLSYEGADDVVVTIEQGVAGVAQTFTAVYTVASATSVTKSGDAPSGSSATFNNTYTNNKQQLTKNNSATLTLTGYDGAKITGITLSMKSNKSAGTGSYTMTVGGKTISSIASATFKSWYGSYSESFVPVTPAVTATTVGSGEDVVVTISATVNSLYIEKYTITYEM